MRAIIDIDEIWTDVKEYEGLYSVSNLGRIKSHHFTNSKIIKGWDNGEGYFAVDLKKDGISKKVKIHKLVCNAFLRTCGAGEMVNHKNSNRSDNTLLNLEIVSSRENNCHRVKGKKKYSNLTGVSYISSAEKRTKRWIAQITINGKCKNLGYFITEAEAYAARIQYEKSNNIVNMYL
jgi:hypothetical protein